jgi:hypothetical protein
MPKLEVNKGVIILQDTSRAPASRVYGTKIPYQGEAGDSLQEASYEEHFEHPLQEGKKSDVTCLGPPLSITLWRDCLLSML